MNTLGIKKYQSLPPHLPNFFPGYKSLRNKVEDDLHNSLYTSRTDKEGSIDNLKAIDKKY